MVAYRLSKSKLLSGLQCPKRLYLEIHHPELAEYSEDTEVRFASGHLVGELARQRYPQGNLIEHIDDLQTALAETKTELEGGGEKMLFEPAFQHGGVLVRADIFSRDKAGRCRNIEVKSSTSVKDYHYDDAAIQYWVINGAGYPLDSISIMHIDREFVYPGGGDYGGLFKQANVTDEIIETAAQVPAWVKEFQNMLAGDMPEIETGAHCSKPFDCPFQGFCSKDDPEYPVELLPRGGKIAQRLRADGYRDLREVPENLLESDKYKWIWRVTKSGKAELDPKAEKIIRSLPYPRFYLDFETIQFAVPIWVGTRPYEQLPFQWSCHIEGATGDLVHREFLDTSGEPPMRRFAESLISTLGDSGTVLVYGSFEGGVLKTLAGRYPDLEVPLGNIVRRITNLIPITRDHYYHPAMKGSWSLKVVLPTVAPELNYGNLGEVQEGGAAQAAYLEIIDSATSDERRETLKNDLLEYCKRDTLALIRLIHFLAA